MGVEVDQGKLQEEVRRATERREVGREGKMWGEPESYTWQMEGNVKQTDQRQPNSTQYFRPGFLKFLHSRINTKLQRRAKEKLLWISKPPRRFKRCFIQTNILNIDTKVLIEVDRNVKYYFNFLMDCLLVTGIPPFKG